MDTKQNRPVVVVAGATGDLGFRIVNALAAKGALVRALVRRPVDKLALDNVDQVSVDLSDSVELTRAVTGAASIVSALNGTAPVILGAQSRLLDAALAARVPHFIPSDFSLDYLATRPGYNRNMDLRREFTTKDDVAAFTADAAMDPAAPRFLRISGDQISPRGLAELLTGMDGKRWTLLRAGGIGLLSTIIAVARTLTPKTDAPFPVWQGMQYLRDMSTGRAKLHGLNNGHYGKADWTGVAAILAPTLRTDVIATKEHRA